MRTQADPGGPKRTVSGPTPSRLERRSPTRRIADPDELPSGFTRRARARRGRSVVENPQTPLGEFIRVYASLSESPLNFDSRIAASQLAYSRVSFQPLP